MRVNEPEPNHEEELKNPKIMDGSSVLIGLCTFCILPYVILGVYGAGLHGVAIWLSNTFPIFEPRIAFLKLIDNYSHLAFAATLISSAVTAPLCLFIMSFCYWKNVFVTGYSNLHWRNSIAHGKSGSLNFKDHFKLIVFVPTVLFGLYVGFVFTPTLFHPNRLGMAFSFLWPVFPVIGTLVVLLAVSLSFMLAIGALIFIQLRRKRNGEW